MNAILILSTLLIGASTPDMPGNTGQQLSPQFAPPTSDLPLPPAEVKKASPGSNSTRSSAMRGAQSRGAQRTQPQARSMRSGYADSSRSTSKRDQNQDIQPTMPFAPTDSNSMGQVGQNYQWLPPTENAAAGGGGSAGSGGRPSGLFGPMNVPSSPTKARPGMSQSYSSMQNAEQQNRRMAAARNATATTPQMTAKPFSGAQQTSSGVSPYMNLFRNGNSNGTIDNYTTLVRPELDQRRANQQFGADIHGLENSTHVQGLSIRQLDRQTQSLQGVKATQYYMNYGDYYQGAR